MKRNSKPHLKKRESLPVLLQKAVQVDKTIPWWRVCIGKITIRVVAGVISGLIVAILLLIHTDYPIIPLTPFTLSSSATSSPSQAERGRRQGLL